jgi:hypothetical protein
LLQISPKSIRFGKRFSMRGRYYQDVRDQHGRLVARLPWNQQVKREVRSVVEVVRGTGPVAPRQLRQLGLDVPGWEYERGSLEVEYGSANWSRRVFQAEGIPLGEPGGRVRGSRRGRSGKWLGALFEALDPSDWSRLLANLPKRLQETSASNFRLRLTVRDREGNLHTVTDPTERLIQSLDSPAAYREMLATAAGLAAQRYGYAGATELVSIDLVMGAQAEGAEGMEEGFPYGYNV